MVSPPSTTNLSMRNLRLYSQPHPSSRGGGKEQLTMLQASLEHRERMYSLGSRNGSSLRRALVAFRCRLLNVSTVACACILVSGSWHAAWDSALGFPGEGPGVVRIGAALDCLRLTSAANSSILQSLDILSCANVHTTSCSQEIFHDGVEDGNAWKDDNAVADADALSPPSQSRRRGVRK